MTPMTQERLREIVDYDANTGLFTHRPRADRSQSWHTRFAGKTAGCVTRGYVRICFEGARYSAHRLAFLYMTGEIPGTVDHINRDTTDNRWANLRAVTPAENKKNQKTYKNNAVGLNGVRWDGSRWTAGIGINGRWVSLYGGKDFLEACCARKSAELRHGYHPNHGDPKPETFAFEPPVKAAPNEDEVLEWARTALLPSDVRGERATFRKGIKVITVLRALKRWSEGPEYTLTQEQLDELHENLESLAL